MRRTPVIVLIALVVVGLAVTSAFVVTRSDGGPGSGPGDGPPTETVLVAAPRGRILDRTGKVLVEDGTLLELRADPAVLDDLPADERDAVLADLAELIATDRAGRVPAGAGVNTGAQFTPAILADRLAAGPGSATASASADDPLVLATAVGQPVREAVEGDPDRFPGVSIAPVGGRTYPYGVLAAHVLGYLGEATAEDVETLDLPAGAMVGRAGVERSADVDLRGRPGEIVYEVDAQGNRVRELVDRRVEPTPGRDVHLTIDVNLQYLAEKGLAAEVARRRGVVDNGCFLEGGCDPTGAAAVAVDPRTGAVLVAASYPTYDPLLFAGGIATADHDALAAEDRADEHDLPLLDRAVAGQYAPASTFKPFVAHAGAAVGLLDPGEIYDDTGVYRYSADCPIDEDNNCSAQNPGRTPHGAIALEDALRVSSDTYFYALGDEAWRARDELGEEVLQEGLAEWGFGAATGIDLPGDPDGRVPTPDWLRQYSEELNADDPELAAEAGRWTPGVSGNLAAGHGDVLVTPLQLARAYGALAEGGTLWRPHVVGEVAGEAVAPEADGEVDLPADVRDPLIAGLDGVTKGPGGTATTAFGGFDQSACPVMGKTGTAQVTGKNDTSLFAAVAPTPTEGREAAISLAVVVEEAGFGATAAVPVSRRVLEPFAAVGCDIEAFGADDSPYTAPTGGWFDVAEAVAEYVPPGADGRD